MAGSSRSVKGTLVQFGAGNIGRSFIGKVFSQGGYEVVFVDIDRTLLEALNEAGRYRVIVKRNDERDETVWVDGVRAIDGRDGDAVACEIAHAAYVATSVGQGALPHIFPPIAAGLNMRFRTDSPPLDIIIAENVRDGATVYANALGPLLRPSVEIGAAVGLVETSIGKMVPIMTERDRARDPLWIFAEAYDVLIVDRRGFCGPLPAIPRLEPVDNIHAYVDRKLFIHNLGHAAAAYLGYQRAPDASYLYQVLEERGVEEAVREAMEEAAAALHAEYPRDLRRDDLARHIEDLVERFKNRALKDTVHRVGRDLYRKLGKNDRLVGAMLLAAKHGSDSWERCCWPPSMACLPRESPRSRSRGSDSGRATRKGIWL